MSNITIHDVAQKAGVSVTTVSRVLNNRGYISEQTRKKVNDAIQELNYTPNEIARSFFTNESKFIALVVPTIDNPFFSELTFYIERKLAAKGYHLFLCNSLNDSENEKQFLRLLKEKRVDGIIVGSHNMDIAEYENYEDKIVSIERHLTDRIPMVQSDDYDGGKQATRILLEQGCTNILCVGGDKSILTPANDRALAYADEMAKEKLDSHYLEIPFHLSLAEKVERIENLFASGMKYDGIFAGDDIAGKMFLNTAKKYGVAVPDELKIIGFDGTQSIRTLNPELSTIIQPIEELAEQAVSILLKCIAKKKVPAKTILPVKAYLSDSTGNK